MLTAGSTSYTYDDDGYLATKTVGFDGTTYTYSRAGALKRVALPNNSGVIDYVLDAGEQRIAKKINGVVTEKYLWAGLTGLLAVYDGSDILVARFEYADGPLPVKMVQGGSTYYIAYDQVGSLRAVLDTGGTIVHEITYDSFGDILTEANSGLTVHLGFAGCLSSVLFFPEAHNYLFYLLANPLGEFFLAHFPPRYFVLANAKFVGHLLLGQPSQEPQLFDLIASRLGFWHGIVPDELGNLWN